MVGFEMDHGSVRAGERGLGEKNTVGKKNFRECYTPPPPPLSLRPLANIWQCLSIFTDSVGSGQHLAVFVYIYRQCWYSSEAFQGF